MQEFAVIDGSAGESGSRFLASALALANATGRPVRLLHTGLSREPRDAARLGALRAAARISKARVTGDLDDVRFVPGEVEPTDMVEELAGAAGVSLLVETIAAPLALATGPSRVTVKGGTHVPKSPIADFLSRDWAEAMEAAGLSASVRLVETGYAPEGGGEVLILVAGNGRARPIRRRSRRNLQSIRGAVFFTDVPRFVPEKVAREARLALRRSGVPVRVDVEERSAGGSGLGIFLACVTEDGARTSFSSLGSRDRPPARVAREAVNALFAWLDTGAALQADLAERMIVPLALAEGTSELGVSRVTRRMEAAGRVVTRFTAARVRIEGKEGEPGVVWVEGS